MNSDKIYVEGDFTFCRTPNIHTSHTSSIWYGIVWQPSVAKEVVNTKIVLIR